MRAFEEIELVKLPQKVTGKAILKVFDLATRR
jgi:hypothetical protein